MKMCKIIKTELSSKVLMAGNYYENHHPGGISAVVQYWSEYIEDLQYYPTYKLSNVGVRVWWFFYSYLRLAIRMMFDSNVKILHLHSAADGSFLRKSLLVKLGKFFKKKVVLHIHASRFKDFYNESSSAKQKWIINTIDKVDVLIVLSNSWREWFISIGVPEDKIVVLHNITAFPTVLPGAKVNDGKIHFLFLGEIGHRKGVFDIIRAISNHKEALAGKIELRIGGNKNEELLLSEIREHGLEDIVKFEGWVGGEKKLQLLNWSDIFILPSFNEGLPISILEAMSYGQPIISTAVGGIPEVVENGINGIIVTPGNDDEIYASMMFYVQNKDCVIEHGLESKKRVESYMPNYVMNHLRHIYEKLLLE